jgi:hypothetical protein
MWIRTNLPHMFFHGSLHHPTEEEIICHGHKAARLNFLAVIEEVLPFF